MRVLAAAANFPDVLLCRGTYQVKVPLPFTLGVELCGEVIEVGEGVTCFSVGDRVIGDTALPHGAFAEYALMDSSAALLRLTETGVIKTMVTERLSLADVPDGLRRLGAGTTTGRIVFIP